MIESNPKRLGHFTVDGVDYVSLIEALKAANQRPDKVQYYFNNDVYDQYDWTKDPFPHLSLNEMYRMRAQELRDNCKYLVVMLSGGPDSVQVLKSFCDNGIHVDEVINYNSYDRTGRVDGTINNADYVHNAKPLIERLQREGKLKAKITIYDEISMMLTHWKNLARLGWEDVAIDNGGPNSFLLRASGHIYNPELWAKIRNREGVYIVNGFDKPFCTLINNKRALYHNSFIVGNYNEMIQHPEYACLADVWQWFYSARETAPLQIKQAHTLKNFTDSHPEPEYYRHEKYSQIDRTGHSWHSKHGHGNLKYEIFHRLIYPEWSPTVVTPKPGNMLMRERDSWWIQDLPMEDKKIWVHSAKKSLRQIPSTDIKARSRFLSKPRFIE